MHLCEGHRTIKTKLSLIEKLNIVYFTPPHNLKYSPKIIVLVLLIPSSYAVDL